MGARYVAIELRACVRFNLPDAVADGPRAVTYGFAAVCRKTTPPAIIKMANRKNGNDMALAAGKNRKLPTATSNNQESRLPCNQSF